MRILHTADWHLGKTLYGEPLDHAHQAFARWLADTIVERSVDVLVHAGDVFDRAVPSAQAEQLLYAFLADIARRRPGIRVIAIAGNHDGPSRLAAPAPLLDQLGVHVEGRLSGDLHSRVVTVRAPHARELRIAPIPFLRPSDLVAFGESPDVRVRRLFEQARASLGETGGAFTLALGHAHVRGGKVSHGSERTLIGGEDAQVPAEAFDVGFDHVALGHLHRAQSFLDGRVRYAGSPFALGFGELGAPHSVDLLTVDERGGQLETIPTPIFQRLMRLDDGQGGAIALEEALLRASALDDTPTWVAAKVLLAPGALQPRRELEGRLPPGARLLAIEVVRPHTASESHRPHRLEPVDVLEEAWRRARGDSPADSIRGTFAQALAEAEAIVSGRNATAERTEER